VCFETTEAALVGHWDQPRLARVVANLLGNAVKYSPGGGPIEVRVSREGGVPGCAVLTVMDRGMGIPEAEIDRVFERFQRGTNVVGLVPGTGLGLASARHIVESHGGTIAAANRPGPGAVFTVRLPLVAELA
jgi:signal transduction histidine kinase